MMDSLDYELIAILITLLGGFGTVIWQISRRSRDIDILHRDMSQVKEDLEHHEDHCYKRESDVAEKLRGIRSKVGENYTQIELLKQGQEHIKTLIGELKEAFEKVKK